MTPGLWFLFGYVVGTTTLGFFVLLYYLARTDRSGYGYSDIDAQSDSDDQQ